MAREFSEAERIKFQILAGKIFYDSLSPTEKGMVDALSEMMIKNMKSAVDAEFGGKNKRAQKMSRRPSDRRIRKQSRLKVSIGDMLKAKKEEA